MSDVEREPLLAQLEDDWQVVDGHHLERTWKFDDFQAALNFVNAAGAVCEEEFHHADFDFGWGRARFTICPHKIAGLTASAVVVAS